MWSRPYLLTSRGDYLTAPGEHADALRALGHFLDQVGATGIEIRSEDGEWSVVWDATRGTHLQPFHLQALRTVAWLHRGIRGSAAAFNLTTALRTLGELLDTTRATSFRISQVAEGFEMAAAVGDHEGTRLFTIAEIEELAREQQERRVA